MEKSKYFYAEESQSYPNHYLIRPNFETLPLKHTQGSFAILPARICGLSYAQYLRMCRDCFDAEIIGKGSMYPVAYFVKNEKMNLLLKTLNGYASMIIWDIEHPEHLEHKKFVMENSKNPRWSGKNVSN